EDGGLLRRRTLRARDGENDTDLLRQRVGGRAAFAADREAKPAEVVVHVVVAVPTAVPLDQAERQHGAAGLGDIPRRGRDGLARLVAPAGPGVDAPGRLVPVVDGVLDRAGDAAALRAVVEIRLQGALGIGVVGGGLLQLHPGLLARLPDAGGLDLELGQG